MKITFMGAGSTIFARNVIGDCMCTPALCESEFALYDIDEKRLKESEIILSAINRNINEGKAKITTYTIALYYIILQHTQRLPAKLTTSLLIRECQRLCHLR